MSDRDSVPSRLHPHRYDVGPDMTTPYADFDEDWWTDPDQRYRALARTVYWTFLPHSRNAPTRKIVTSLLMITWATITIGTAFGYAEPGDYYAWISMLVFSIVGTIWGFELGLMDAISKDKGQSAHKEGGDD